MRPIKNEIELGAALRDRRERARLTQAQTAELAGVSRAFVIDLERGLRPRAQLNRVMSVIRALDAALTLVDYHAPSVEQAVTDLLADS